MNITLKKVKVHDGLSEETICFTADVYVDGILKAHASNRGHGGCNDIQPAKGFTHQDVQDLTPIDIESQIMELAEEANIVKKNQTSAFVTRICDDIFTHAYKYSFAKMKKGLGAAKFNAMIDKKRRELEASGHTILNTNI